jgi:hypothetical protein
MVTQTTEHADEFVCLGVKLFERFFVEEALLLRDEPLADQFVERADGKLNEPGKVLTRRTRAPLCDVGRHRDSRPSHLAGDAKLFDSRKLLGEAINKRCRFDCPLPDVKLLEVKPSFLFF